MAVLYSGDTARALVPENLSFKLGKDRQQAGHGAAGWGVVRSGASVQENKGDAVQPPDLH